MTARQGVAIPELPPGLVNRPRLEERCRPLSRRLTLVVAGAGFGKTTHVAAVCRSLIGDGVRVAWLTLGDERAETVEGQLASALVEAGPQPELTPAPEGGGRARSAELAGAVEELGEPFVLVLDNAERGGQAVGLLNELFAIAPSNLHLVVAGRELPTGLDVYSPPLWEGTAITSAADLRFDAEEVEAFFEGDLSATDAAAVVEETWGWPAAVAFRRNEHRSGSDAEARVLRQAAGSWVESAVLGAADESDREFLLDAALFEWFDEALLGDVLGEAAGFARLEGTSALDGLVARSGEAAEMVARLHPLVREHCARRRRIEAPERYREVRRQIARTLAGRGHTVEAMRQAHDAGDGELAAAVFLQAGGARVCIGEGVEQLVAADSLVPEASIHKEPRLAAARCMALAMSGRVGDARRLYASLPWKVEAGDDDAERDLAVDRCLARASIGFSGCESGPGEARALVAAARDFVAETGVDLAARVGVGFMSCVLANLAGEVGEAVRQGRGIRGAASGVAPFLGPAVELQLGLAAMAEGRVLDAVAHYGTGSRLAADCDPATPVLNLLATTLVNELNLERSRLDQVTVAPGLPEEFRRGAELAGYFAACDVAVETTFLSGGATAALAMLDEMQAHARYFELPALQRHLVAVTCSILADAGRAGEAETAWAVAGLPSDEAGCLDLGRQGWREVESLSCARIRLLAARGELDAGRRLLARVLRLAAQKRLRRMEMRSLAVAMRLEARAGSARAYDHLETFAERFAVTDYLQPLAREGETAIDLVRRYLARTDLDPARRDGAAALLAALDRDETQGRPLQLTARELDVLERMGRLRDDDIAGELGISATGSGSTYATCLRSSASGRGMMRFAARGGSASWDGRERMPTRHASSGWWRAERSLRRLQGGRGRRRPGGRRGQTRGRDGGLVPGRAGGSLLRCVEPCRIRVRPRRRQAPRAAARSGVGFARRVDRDRGRVACGGGRADAADPVCRRVRLGYLVCAAGGADSWQPAGCLGGTDGPVVRRRVGGADLGDALVLSGRGRVRRRRRHRPRAG